MEQYLYLAVRIAAAAYILHRLYRYLRSERFLNIWKSLPVNEMPQKQEKPVVIVADKPGVVGATKAVYIEDPKRVSEAPERVLELEPADNAAPAPEPQDEPEDIEVESALGTEKLPEEELYDDSSEAPPLTDYDFSTGMTYDQLTQAIGFLSRPTDNDEDMLRAADTLASIRTTELFDFLVSEQEHKDAICRLFGECLDGNGAILSKRRSKMPSVDITRFDINRYI